MGSRRRVRGSGIEHRGWRIEDRGCGIDLRLSILDWRSLILGSAGQCEIEGRALSGRGFEPDVAAVTFDNLFADCQSGAGSLVFVRLMQAAENAENLLVIARINADAVVLHKQR